MLRGRKIPLGDHLGPSGPIYLDDAIDSLLRSLKAPGVLSRKSYTSAPDLDRKLETFYQQYFLGADAS